MTKKVVDSVFVCVYLPGKVLPKPINRAYVCARRSAWQTFGLDFNPPKAFSFVSPFSLLLMHTGCIIYSDQPLKQMRATYGGRRFATEDYGNRSHKLWMR